MIINLKRVLSRNGYLLIIAATLYIFSVALNFTTKLSPSQVKDHLQQYIKKGEQQFTSFAADTAFLSGVATSRHIEAIANKYYQDKVGLFVHQVDPQNGYTIKYWNNNQMLPDDSDILRPDGTYLVQHENGTFEFLKKSVQLNGKPFVTTALIPLHWSYFLNNTYLQPSFPAVGNLEKQYDISYSPTSLPVKNGQGRVLFWLSKKKLTQHEAPGTLPLVLRILAVVFSLVFINSYALEVARTRAWYKGFGVLAAAVLMLRTLSYFLPFPFEFRNLPLFDNLVYASNFLHPSLGDLFINMVLAFWLVSFVKLTAIRSFQDTPSILGRKGWILTFFLSAVFITVSFVSAGLTRSLIKDSSISFDVMNFYSLDAFSLVSFITLCFIVLTFFHLSHIILVFMYKAINVPAYARYIVTAVCGLLYLSLLLEAPATTSNSIVLVWLLLFMLIMELRKEDIPIPVFRSSFFVIWLIFFAASISALIIYQNERKRIDEGRKTAESLAWEADPTMQNLMRAGIVDIDSAFLSSNINRWSHENSNRYLKDSLTRLYFSANFNKYNTRLYTYDSSCTPLFNEDSMSYYELRNVIATRSSKTFHPDLYYYEKEAGVFGFIYNKIIYNPTGGIYGYFFVVVEPKKYKSQTIYPELLKTTEDVESDLDITHAIYDNGQLVKSNGDYTFVSVIPKERIRQEFSVINKGNYKELWYNAGSNKLVIVVQKSSPFVEFITLFAYLFGSFLLIIVFFQLGHFLLKYRFSFKRLRNDLRLNIRQQIQGAIIFITVFSFIIIGIVTITFYISRFHETNRDRLVKAINVLGNEIERQIYNHILQDDVLKIYDEGANANLQHTIQEVSEVHALDANLYDLDGNLQATTQPEIYTRQLLSSMMEPHAYIRLHEKKEIQYIQDETVGKFSFVSIYMPLNDGYGKPYAYLNIPYLNTQQELNQEISNFLVTLINLNAFIFVIAGAISVLLTNRITNSFSLIGSKMRQINLGQTNDEIEWHSNDEIGALVKEYNKMVGKLEKSAQALAKSEREGAWREMARQVAHEIKNPLTPMKLSIQHLQRAIQENNPDARNLSQRVASTLVEQIDQLAKIASDFSQFANIGVTKVERFDLHEQLQSLIDLYSSNEKVKINFSPVHQQVFIDADKTQVNRLFTNLLQNAIEAGVEQQIIVIDIIEERDANNLIVHMQDNGSGIPEEKRDKIFTPNFTTKSSGTGLGLAMCKGIVEKANGKIWFTSEEGKGTTFHVLFPLIVTP